MKIIGITGAIGSGKSTVAAIMARRGAAVIDADAIGHELLREDAEIRRRLTGAFGKEIRNDAGEIDRAHLAARVFGNPEAIVRLNAIMHPRINEITRQRIAVFKAQGREVVVIDAPLLIETGGTAMVDEVWVTEAPREVTLRRLRERSELDEAAVMARLDAQTDAAARRRQADLVIDTALSLADLETVVAGLWEQRIGSG